MLKAYINYPNAQVTVHRDLNCTSVRQQDKAGQRSVRLNGSNLSMELSKFSNRTYHFASETEHNDMWIEVDFGDENFELAVVDHIRWRLAVHYKPFVNARVSEHCN